MGLLQRSTAVSVTMLAALPVAGAGVADSEHMTVACCLGENQLNTTGLGQAHPLATNLSADPTWRVYAFRRDGVSYFQVNDLTGRVQLIVGSLDGLFWALPAGETSSQVVLPPQRMAIPQAAVRSEVYQHPTFSLVCYRTGESTVWSIEVPGTAR